MHWQEPSYLKVKPIDTDRINEMAKEMTDPATKSMNKPWTPRLQSEIKMVLLRIAVPVESMYEFAAEAQKLLGSDGLTGNDDLVFVDGWRGVSQGEWVDKLSNHFTE